MVRPTAGVLTRDAVDRLAAQRTDSRVFRAQVLDRLRRVVGFDWYAWVLTDPATTVGVDPLAHLPDLAVLPAVVRLKYLTVVNRWTSLNGVARLGGHATESALWREVQGGYGVADVASVVFRDRFGCWGFLDLWARRAYTAEDLAVLRELTPALTEALRARQARTFEVVAAAPPTSLVGPVVLLLADDSASSARPEPRTSGCGCSCRHLARWRPFPRVRSTSPPSSSPARTGSTTMSRRPGSTWWAGSGSPCGRPGWNRAT